MTVTGLITTDIIPSAADALWEPAPQLDALTQRPVVAIAPQYGSPAEEEQLRSILTAGCKLQADQYHIIQLRPGQVLPWFRMVEQAAPKVVLFFGVQPAELGISALFRFCEVNSFGGALWIPAFPLAQLVQDKAAKGQLWNNALKPVFETKTYGNLL